MTRVTLSFRLPTQGDGRIGTIGGGGGEVDGWITFDIGALTVGRPAGAVPKG